MLFSDFLDAMSLLDDPRDAEKAYIAAGQRVPFLDEKVMDDTPPDCSAASFMEPKLRRSRFSFRSINWNRSTPIGGGMDGFVWKVWFGQQGPFALKVFWDTKPFPDWLTPAVQRECQNTALLQMIATALKRAAKDSTPITGWLDPHDRDDADHNLLSFADEWRTQDKDSKLTGEAETMSTMPRVAKCYGWLSFTTDEYKDLVPSNKWAPSVWIEKNYHRHIEEGRGYIGIVYEWIEEGKNDLEMIEKACRFFYLAGFSWHPDMRIMMQNWHQGVLVDHSDIIQPRGLGWQKWTYGMEGRTAEAILKRMNSQERLRHGQLEAQAQ